MQESYSDIRQIWDRSQYLFNAPLRSALCWPSGVALISQEDRKQDNKTDVVQGPFTNLMVLNISK